MAGRHVSVRMADKRTDVQREVDLLRMWNERDDRNIGPVLEYLSFYINEQTPGAPGTLPGKHGSCLASPVWCFPNRESSSSS